MTNQSLLSLFGLLIGETLANMKYDTFDIALVQNTCSMVTNFSGLVIGFLLKRYSPRIVTLIGVLLTSIGTILSSFSTSFAEVIVTYSIFTGNNSAQIPCKHIGEGTKVKCTRPLSHSEISNYKNNNGRLHLFCNSGCAAKISTNIFVTY